MTATAPITKKQPSNRDLAEAVKQLHDCLHAVQEEGRERELAIRQDMAVIAEGVARLEGSLAMIGRVFSLPSPAQLAEPGFTPKVRATVAAIGPAKAFAAIASAMGGILIIYRLAVGIWPALHHALMTVTP